MKKYYYTLVMLSFSIFLFQCSAVNQMARQKAIRGPQFEPYDGLKQRIAIIDFENTSPHGGRKFGSAVADRLISLLVKSGRFVIVERSRIQKVLQEQAMGQSGAITEATAPQVGKLLGVQAIITGTILEAEQKTGATKLKSDDDEKKNKWKLALKASVGRVKIAYRMIDVNSGEILIANTITGSEILPGIGFENKKFDFTDMFELDETVLGFALRKAINSMAVDIVRHAPRLVWQGKVIKIKDDRTLYFMPGKSAGVQLNQVFRIYRSVPVDEGADVAESVPVGLLRVIDFVGQKVTKAQILEGDSIEIGDRVRPVRKRRVSREYER